MKHPHPPHGRETLARGAVCTVELCDCGCLHLSLGALTVRLDPAAAQSLCATLDEALAEVRRRRDEASWSRGVGGLS